MSTSRGPDRPEYLLYDRSDDDDTAAGTTVDPHTHLSSDDLRDSQTGLPLGNVDSEALRVFQKSPTAPVRHGRFRVDPLARHFPEHPDRGSRTPRGVSVHTRNALFGAGLCFALVSAGVFIAASSDSDEYVSSMTTLPNVRSDAYVGSGQDAYVFLPTVLSPSEVAFNSADALSLPGPISVADEVRGTGVRVRRVVSKIPSLSKKTGPFNDDDDTRPMTPKEIEALNEQRLLFAREQKILFDAAEAEKLENGRQKAIQEGRPIEEDWE